MKLFLLDAYALIYRAYYAFIKNPRYNSKGQNTSAILGFVNTLEEVIRNEKPTHLGVAFDPQGGTFRHKAYPQYKAQREETPEAIRFAVPVIKNILEAYHIPILEVNGFEADDVIGTLAHQADAQGIETYMMTPDKDYGQLVTEKVKMYKPGTGKSEALMMGPEEVCKKWGIENTHQVIDILGLMGDASDNIPGCPGVGEKTACTLIQKWGGVEGLLQNIPNLKGAIQKKVSENVDQIRQSYWLATIVTNAPITLDMNALELEEPDRETLDKIFDELEFKSLKKRKATKAGSSEDSAQEETPEKKETKKGRKNKTKFDDGVVQGDLFDFSDKADKTPAEPTKEQPQSSVIDNGEFVVLQITAESKDIRQYREVLENPTTLKIGYNLKSQIHILHEHGINLCGTMYDVMIAHYILHPEMRHGKEYLLDVYEAKDILELQRKLDKELIKENMLALFTDMEMPLMPVLARMEENGVCIDEKGLAETSKLFTEQLKAIEWQIYALAQQQFNISSPRQVGEILFDKLKLDPKAKKTKTGQYTTNEEVLEALKGKHEIVGKIIEYRGFKKLLSTYIDALPKMVNPKTGHIHTSFNQTVTATGRLSSSNPNLQNIPVRDALGKEVRKAFIPNAGQEFFSADYSQIELRIMAHLSQDPHLVEAFKSGKDIHAATAAKIFHKPIEEVTSDERRKAKTANFGIIYGISAFGLAERIGCSRSEAKQLIDDYFTNYPDVKKYMEKSIEMARENGYTETVFGRRCQLPDINSNNSVVRGYAERNAINAPIQGTAADIIKVAMINIDRRMQEEHLKSKMILQVHDELNFTVPPEEKEKLQTIVIDEMQKAAELSVPLIADAGWGSNWLEAH